MASIWVLKPEELYVAVDKKRRHDRTSFRKIAKDLGISSSTITRLGHGRCPDVNSFASIVKWLDAKAEDFFTERQHESVQGYLYPFQKAKR